MWVAKFEASGEAFIGSKAKKHNITAIGYPISSFLKGKWIYVSLVGFISGEDKDKKAFLKDMKKEKRTKYLEVKDDFIIGQMLEPKEFSILYSPEIIHFEPLVIKPDGTQIWTIGSWKRGTLIKFAKIYEKYRNIKLLKIEQKNINDFSVLSIIPKLTEKQKQAINLALQYGYYEYPRKIELKKLAKLMKIAYSTFQEHLRKAESKLLPYSIKKY